MRSKPDLSKLVWRGGGALDASRRGGVRGVERGDGGAAAGQVFDLRTTGADGQNLWAYRYRCGGRGSKRVQRGGFASERDASEALGRALGRLRRQRRLSQSLTLAELVDEYLVQHDAEPVTIAKLQWCADNESSR